MVARRSFAPGMRLGSRRTMRTATVCKTVPTARHRYSRSGPVGLATWPIIRISTWSHRPEASPPRTPTGTAPRTRISGGAGLDPIASSDDRVRVGDHLIGGPHAGASSADPASSRGHGRGKPEADRGNVAGRGARPDGGDGAVAQGGAAFRRPGRGAIDPGAGE